jgi:hypothetical protein
VNPIRPNLVPPSTQSAHGAGAAGQEAAKLAAQRAFFAALGKTEAPSAAAAPQAPTATAAPARAAEAPQKIPRPGSLLDIRV